MSLNAVQLDKLGGIKGIIMNIKLTLLQVLENLYDKVVQGGYIVIDDYCMRTARKATDDFRAQRRITEDLMAVNENIVLWKKLC